jgi:hypothetical protein
MMSKVKKMLIHWVGGSASELHDTVRVFFVPAPSILGASRWVKLVKFSCTSQVPFSLAVCLDIVQLFEQQVKIEQLN